MRAPPDEALQLTSANFPAAPAGAFGPRPRAGTAPGHGTLLPQPTRPAAVAAERPVRWAAAADSRMTLQDLGSLGELIGGIAVVVSLIYLGVQIRHNTRGLDQNAELMRLSFEESIRREAIEFRSTISADSELASIWTRGLASMSSLESAERARFELLMSNVVAILRAQFDAERRGLFPSDRGVFFRFIAGTRGFREWWERLGIPSDPEFSTYVDSQARSRTAAGQGGSPAA